MQHLSHVAAMHFEGFVLLPCILRDFEWPQLECCMTLGLGLPLFSRKFNGKKTGRADRTRRSDRAPNVYSGI